MQNVDYAVKAFIPRLDESKYRAYTLQNFRQIPQIQRLSEEQKFAMEVVGRVLPFKTNNYAVEELIDWSDPFTDPLFHLNFPQKNMLEPHHFDEMAAVLRREGSKEEVAAVANKIRTELNPHPAGQMEHNVPEFEGEKLNGMQHKYKETVLFFPSQGQTCHAYCTFCFRWPQFVKDQGLKFAMNESQTLVRYIKEHPEVTDLLITGGDPMVMKAKYLALYINAILDADIPHLQTIRIGTKALAFWPYRFLTDPDAEEVLDIFEKVSDKGIHLAFMAHFSHPNELKTEAVQRAIARIRETGAQIRTQSPLLNHINGKAQDWADMWQEQVRLGCIPYYMFVPRNTGAQHYFGMPLVKAWEIYQEAYRNGSGLARTAAGPTMSATPGKVQMVGISEIHGEKIFVLRLLQGRNPDWVDRPFFAKYDEKATWFYDLKPALGEEKFFFEK